MKKCEKCEKIYHNFESYRKHCGTIHEEKVSKKVKLSEEEKKLKNREKVARFRSKKQKKQEKSRKLYKCKAANTRGCYGSKNPIVYYGPSTIRKAGNGVFANEDLFPGDIVTGYSGKIVSIEPKDKEYAIQVGSTVIKYIDGIKKPIKNKGLATFVNRESRIASKKRKNCRLIEEIGQKYKVYIQITKKIKKDDELLTTYGKSYRIHKKNK